MLGLRWEVTGTRGSAVRSWKSSVSGVLHIVYSQCHCESGENSKQLVPGVALSTSFNPLIVRVYVGGCFMQLGKLVLINSREVTHLV